MKKLLIISLTLLAFTARAQTKPDIRRSPMDTLNISGITKEQATVIIKGLQASYSAIPDAEHVSAKDGETAKQVCAFFLQAIYKKWPELAPKQQPGK